MVPDSMFDIPARGLALFHTARSYCAQQVRLALEEKHLAWDSRYLDLGRSDHFHPRYARMNPHLVVPTIADDGKVVTNAASIIRYLDARFPMPPLIPRDPQERKRMEFWIEREDRYPVKYLSIANLPDNLRLGQLQSWEARLQSLRSLREEYRADRELAEIYDRKYAEISEWKAVEADKGELRRVTAEMDTMLGEVEAALSRTAFLAGPDYSLADLAWTPVLYRIEECAMTEFWSKGRRPHLERYHAALKARPSFVPAILDSLSGKRR